jgi:ketosteroid isomerase-like protein
MDHAAIAALFDPEGEILHEGQVSTHGRAAIESFLESFSKYQVLENRTEPTSTVVHGDTAEQVGSYHQRVRTPDGQVVEVSGSFRAEWIKAASGTWLIKRMGTSAAR